MCHYIVIGDRLGKGQKVAAGIKKAGGKAIVVPDVAADMKLSDVIKAENANFGISFCSSGGAGTITAQNKYGPFPKEDFCSGNLRDLLMLRELRAII
ncbi:glycine-rich SFCGS family protein, partial [Candidatus Erwinia dacicola]|uniref:glycine-rich SFCGS family protein n=1 Tax=Candidatus Erwinia dacicola TaxID=252393 RepID=UPI001C9BC73D